MVTTIYYFFLSHDVGASDGSTSLPLALLLRLVRCHEVPGCEAQCEKCEKERRGRKRQRENDECVSRVMGDGSKVENSTWAGVPPSAGGFREHPGRVDFFLDCKNG